MIVCAWCSFDFNMSTFSVYLCDVSKPDELFGNSSGHFVL